MTQSFKRKIGESVIPDDTKTVYAYTVGVSDPHVREFVTDYIASTLMPKVILDLGCGSGAYGMELRKKLPDVKLIGVDGCIKYLTSVYCLNLYDMRIHSQIEKFLEFDAFIKWDPELVLCMDVIEHFEKDKAIDLLSKLCSPVIISTPLFWQEQGAVDGNELERHQCFFTEEELKEFGFSPLYIRQYDERGEIGAFIR